MKPDKGAARARFDAVQLEGVKQRFLALNDERILRTRSAMQSRQQIFLDLLPLLFHVNHPILPGYSGGNVAAGIAGYAPGDRILQRLAEHIAPSFDYAQVAPEVFQIQSLFLMGSSGSVGQSTASDLDVWLCHDPTLSAEQLAQLQNKADAICAWVAELGLEVHVFLMNADQFRHGESEQLSAEAVGTSQHYMLLDEFYRSGVLLAGRYPLWWLVPVEFESDYSRGAAEVLRHIDAAEVIDFGGVAEIPRGEFIGAGIWQLYKAISSPYKAVLKLLLTEVYARETLAAENTFTPLCLEFKRQVQDGEMSADALDTYILSYRRLEAYLLERGESNRLELIRRIFYFKTGLRLSQAVGAEGWRRRLMSGLVREWGWQSEQLYNLDAHQSWKLRRVRDEHRFLVAELTNSYRFLQEFAETTGSPALINLEEMTILGRKLFAAFERKRNKVEWLNPGIAPNLAEPQLFFYRLSLSENSGWAVVASPRHDFDTDAILQEDDYLTGLLCWCHCNGLIDKNTQLRLLSRSGDLSEADLRQLSSHVLQHLPRRLVAAEPGSHDLFRRAKVPVAMLIYLNLDRGPLGELSTAIGGSGGSYALASTEIVVVNSWGEVISLAYRGENALYELLRVWQQIQIAARRVKPFIAAPTIEILGFHDSSQSLRERISGLLARLRGAVFGDNSSRYVLKVGSEFWVLQVVDTELQLIKAANYSELVQCLGRAQRAYSAIALDPDCVPGSALAVIAAESSEQYCDIFCCLRGGVADVFVSDECGSLYYGATPCEDVAQLFAETAQFLRSCRGLGEVGLRGFVLDADADGRWTCVPVTPPPIVLHPAPRITARVYPGRHGGGRGRLKFDLAYDGRWWCYSEFGEEVASLLREAVSGDWSSAYLRISTLLLSDAGGEADAVDPSVGGVTRRGLTAQGSVYLRYKRYLEELINGGA